jgi:flagellar biogenesis protein FliO
MEKYIKGNLDSIIHTKKIKFLFSGFFIIALILFVVYVVRCLRITEIHQIVKSELRFLLVG